MRDIDIRTALRLELEERHRGDHETLIIDELDLCLSAARIDVAVVNGRLEGFEIKSDRDNLDRLEGQAEIYGRVFDRLTIIAGMRHIDGVLERVPPWWEVVVACQEPHGTALELVRKGESNSGSDAYSVAQLLWRSEAIAMLEEAGLADGIRSKPRAVLWRALADGLDGAELRQRVRDVVRARGDWRGSLRSSRDDGRFRRFATSSGSLLALPPHKRR